MIDERLRQEAHAARERMNRDIAAGRTEAAIERLEAKIEQLTEKVAGLEMRLTELEQAVEACARLAIRTSETVRSDRLKADLDDAVEACRQVSAWRFGA